MSKWTKIIQKVPSLTLRERKRLRSPSSDAAVCVGVCVGFPLLRGHRLRPGLPQFVQLERDMQCGCVCVCWWVGRGGLLPLRPPHHQRRGGREHPSPHARVAFLPSRRPLQVHCHHQHFPDQVLSLSLSCFDLFCFLFRSYLLLSLAWVVISMCTFVLENARVKTSSSKSLSIFLLLFLFHKLNSTIYLSILNLLSLLSRDTSSSRNVTLVSSNINGTFYVGLYGYISSSGTLKVTLRTICPNDCSGAGTCQYTYPTLSLLSRTSRLSLTLSLLTF